MKTDIRGYSKVLYATAAYIHTSAEVLRGACVTMARKPGGVNQWASKTDVGTGIAPVSYNSESRAATSSYPCWFAYVSIHELVYAPIRWHMVNSGTKSQQTDRLHNLFENRFQLRFELRGLQDGDLPIGLGLK